MKIAPLNEHIIQTIKKDFPRFHVQPKVGVWHMELIGWLMFWMWRFPKNEATGKRKLDRTFMTAFTTTMANGVFISDEKLLAMPSFWRTLAHEYLHLWDSKTLTALVYSTCYMAPQCFALLALGVFWHNAFLIALVFALPLPAAGRYWLEMRGYTMTMACHYWESGQISDKTKAYIIDNFVGSDYYWMMPFRKMVTRRIEKQTAKIISGEILNERPFKTIHDAFRAYEAAL